MIYNNQKEFQEKLESRIHKELSEFPTIDKSTIDNLSKSNFKGFHIKIINRKINIIKENASYELRNYRILEILNLLNFNFILPDTEFIIHTEDQPPINNGPMFVQSKLEENNTILYPDFTFMKWDWPAFPKGEIESWYHFKENIKKYNTPIELKNNKCLFRGADNGSAVPIAGTQKIRKSIYELVKNNPLYDIKFVNFPDTTNFLSLKEHSNYKYLINLPGGSSSGRFKYLLMMNSVVFNIKGRYTEFWYHVLEDCYHYYSIEGQTPEEIVNKMTNKIIELENNSKLYNQIINNLQEIVDYFTFDSVISYWLTLLKEYSQKLNYKVVI